MSTAVQPIYEPLPDSERIQLGLPEGQYLRRRATGDVIDNHGNLARPGAGDSKHPQARLRVTLGDKT